MSEHVRDRYDQEIERFTKNPDPNNIYMAWNEWDSPLFQGICCGGCLTMLKRNPLGYRRFNSKLVDEIMLDGRVPIEGVDIKLEHLPVFAEYQRRIDKEQNRTPPPMLEEVA